MTVNLVQKGKKIKLSQPQQFLAQDRSIVDTAYPGDIIGVHDPGIFNIGDTLCQDDSGIKYKDIPIFAPNHFAKINPINSLKRKQFAKGIQQLAEEGAIQVYKRPNIGLGEIIVGVVGILQFDVLEYRLKNEYGVEISKHPLPHQYIRWIEMDGFDESNFSLTMDALLVENEENEPVLLFQHEWSIKTVEERNPGVKLKEVGGKL